MQLKLTSEWEAEVVILSFVNLAILSRIKIHTSRFIRLINFMKSSLVIRKNVLSCLVLVFTALSFSVNALAQYSKTSFGLYSFNSKIPLVSVDNNRITDITHLGDEGQWANVRLKGGIPAWLKSQDVDLLSNNSLQTVSEKARIYIQPKLNSRYLMTLSKGFTAPILAVKDSWYQVSTPSYLTMKMLKSEYSLLTGGQVIAPKAEVSNVVENATASKSAISKPVSAEPVSVQKTIDKRPIASANSSQRSYLLTPGDIISISVFGEPDMVLSNQRIGESGFVSFPLIGQIVVKGKSTQQVEAMIESLLAKGYLRDPKVNVVVNAYRPIFVRGAVNTPGSYDFTEGLTVSKVLTLAGGISKGAQTDTLKLYRNDELFLQNLTTDSQTFIQPGDILTVTEGIGAVEKASSFIYLHGEVNSPGGYEYREGLTVEKAVALAGGFSPRASKRKINITRESNASEEPEKLKRVKLFLDLKPGDVIHVGASLF